MLNRFHVSMSILRVAGRSVVPLAACMSIAVAGVVRAATFNGSPIVLSGNQTLTISDPDYTIKANIILHDNSTLIIRDSLFRHANDFAAQFSLSVYDNARVIVERSTLSSTNSWQFYDNASFQMTDVTNDIWMNFSGQSTAVVRNVSQYRGTMSFSASVDIDGAREAGIEFVFPAGSTVDESMPATIGSTPYVFPNESDRGVNFRLRAANVGATDFGVTILPESNITFRDTRVGLGPELSRTYSGLTATFDNLRRKLYADDSWPFAGGVIRLVNTYVDSWYPSASGNNRLIVTNSTLADIDGNQDQAQLSISDSLLSVPVARSSVRIDITRSVVNGDVTAIDNGIITITDSVVGGRFIKQGNGIIVATGIAGLGPGFSGFLTGDPSEVITGRVSIKRMSFGLESTPVLTTDPSVIRLSANQTYRLTFKYRIVTAPSKGFSVDFLSQKGLSTGNFLPGFRINGKGGDIGRATLTAKLGPYDDYWANVGIIDTGVLVIDDIQIIDVATGRVIASEGGDGPLSADATCSTPPNAPSGLTSRVSGSTVTLSWSAPSGGCAPVAYVLQAGSAAGLSNLANSATGTTATTYVATGVGPGTYFVRVRAQNFDGQSGPSNEIAVIVGPLPNLVPTSGAPFSRTPHRRRSR
jgi:hypothetical protein